MGRLSLAIGRHKDHGSGGDERPSKSRHFRSSLKGLLGIPSASRASIDLGDLDELSEEHAHALKLSPGNPADLSSIAATPAGSANAFELAQPDPCSAEEGVSLQGPKAPVADIETSQAPITSDIEHSHTQDAANVLPAATTAATSDVHVSTENATATISEDISSEQAALARYSMVVDLDAVDIAPVKDDDHDTDEKHSWRRRGSLLTSRLAAPLRNSSSRDGANLNSNRLLMRKESTPLFSPSSPHKSHHHHLFHRSESGDAANKSSSFWRSGSTLRSSVHAGDDTIPSTSYDIAPGHTIAADTAPSPPERTHRSSSVPFLVPIPASAHPAGSGKPMASPYLRAIASSANSNSSRLNRRDLTMSLSGSRHVHERFPKLSLAGSLDACSPPGSPSPVSLTILNDKAAAAGGASSTPMTFLVSPRPRASTGSKHGIPGVTNALSRTSTRSREFRLDKRTLSLATIPALDVNIPSSPRALSDGVDVSDFGVAASSTTPTSVSSTKHLAMLPPSPVSTSTPARSIASTSASAAFEPLHEEAEDGCSQACAVSQPESQLPPPLQLGRQQDASTIRSVDSVHETHHMEVLHDPHTGRKMINQYMIIRELGRGTHGKVKLAFDTITGDYYAIKVIDKESRDRRLRLNKVSAHRGSRKGATGSRRRSCYKQSRSHGFLRIDIDKMERVKREIAILKKCRHPNVVRLREVIDDAHARRIYLVIEYMDGGEIMWRDASNLPVMAADKARSVFRDLVLGVEYLHYAGILHRDLKPQNLLYNKAGTVKISDFGVSFLSRRMNKHQVRAEEAGIGEEAADHQGGTEVHDTGATVTPLPGASEKQSAQPLPSLHGFGFPSKTRAWMPGPVADAKAPSPLRPAGRSAAVQGATLHRYASQPVMSIGSTRIQPGPVLQRKGSVVSRSSKHLASSGSSEASLHSRYSPRSARQSPQEAVDPLRSPSSQLSQHQATMGMTDEFGRRRANPSPSTRPYVVSPLSSPLGASAAVPEFKLPPEITSTDVNVYDPFDSSDSDEFFSHSSAESESDYGNHYAGDDNADSEDSESEDGIVFGMLPAKPVAPAESPRLGYLGDDSGSRADSVCSEPPQHLRKGTLGDINVSFDEKDEERELAKTAGTPAFFAPELCCTAEELAKVLKDEHARRQAHMRLVSRNRHITDPMPSAPATRTCVSGIVLDSELESGGKRGGSLRPTSMFIEKSPSTSAATASAGLNDAASATPLGLGGSAKSMKRHSTIVSLLARPFSPKSPKSRSSAASGSTPAHSLLQDELDDELADEPLPANVITPAIDIWAMGVTLYCLIYGRVPFQASTEFELFNIIPRQQLEFPQYLEAAEDSGSSSEPLLFDVQGGSALDEASSAAKPVRKVPLPPPDADLCDLLSRMLDKDFRTRITIEEIKQHPWVVRDLDHPSSWAQETDPTLRPSLNITSQEVEQAVVPKVRSRRGFRASVRRRISMMSPLTSKSQQRSSAGESNSGTRRQQRLKGAATKAKSSLDWLKIWQ
ncbi:hypothetical protein H4218_001546 [Coemansia sp. IMI 209128]|nr:hypothetical protein H4218_001546 [Coemansia sp. IMI 209128]